MRYIVTSKRGSRKLGMQKCLAQDNNAWYLVRILHYTLCLFHASTNASRKITTLGSQTHGILYMEALCTHAKKCLLAIVYKSPIDFLRKVVMTPLLIVPLNVTYFGAKVLVI